MLLTHIATTRSDDRCRVLADRIKLAYEAALIQGQTTRDLGGQLGTREFAQALIQHLKS